MLQDEPNLELQNLSLKKSHSPEMNFRKNPHKNKERFKHHLKIISVWNFKSFYSLNLNQSNLSLIELVICLFTALSANEKYFSLIN